MKTLLVLFALVGTSASLDLSKPAASKDMVNHINSLGTTWKAELNEKFNGRNMSFAKSLCGTFLEGQRVEEAFAKLEKKTQAPAGLEIPQAFDSRVQWKNCSSVIGHIRDQASCGSCWAFGSTEAFNDRLCIKSGGNFKIELSAQDTTSCCNLFGGCFGSSGCDGGIPAEAWTYFKNTGVVSGGDYNTIGSGSSCFPYQLPNCDHHEGGPYPDCQEGGSTPACPNPRACSEKGYATTWAQDKHYGKSSYSLGSVEAIQADIMNYGPVTAAFSVYEDFLTYKSGVYQHKSGSFLGGHAIKILGWGEENGTPYWLVANSWNIYWGDKGYFKILRGSDECGIEDQVVAGQV